MGGWDFSILWLAGRAMLYGLDPYSVPYFYYPLPFAFFLTVFALLPVWVSFITWTIVNFALIIEAFRKDFWQWILFVPMLHQISSGQVELLLWYLERKINRGWKGVILGAIMTLKPQVAILLLSWHIVDWIKFDRKIFYRWFGVTILLWSFPMIWRPNWLIEWWNVTPKVSMISMQNSPGLFSLMKISDIPLGIIVFIAFGIFIWGQLQSKNVARASAVLASPLGLFYSTLALMGCAPAWILVPVSMIAVVGVIMTKSFVSFILLPISVIGWQVYKNKQTLQ